jgi:hypothetical protein
MTTLRQIINERPTWTINDEAIHRGHNYATEMMEVYKQMDEFISMKAKLSNAYQEGFLHGFEHKFDNTNYEEK